MANLTRINPFSFDWNNFNSPNLSKSVTLISQILWSRFPGGFRSDDVRLRYLGHAGLVWSHFLDFFLYGDPHLHLAWCRLWLCIAVEHQSGHLAGYRRILRDRIHSSLKGSFLWLIDKVAHDHCCFSLSFLSSQLNWALSRSYRLAAVVDMTLRATVFHLLDFDRIRQVLEYWALCLSPDHSERASITK